MRLSRRPLLRVKGQAELIGALFAFIILVMFTVYTVANILPSATRQQLQMQEMQSLKQLQEFEKEGLEVVWDPESKVLKIRNNSTIPIKTVRVWVEENGDVKPIQVNIVLEPGEEVKLGKETLGSSVPLRVETSRGTIVDVKKPPRERGEGGGGLGPRVIDLTQVLQETLDVTELRRNPNILVRGWWNGMRSYCACYYGRSLCLDWKERFPAITYKNVCVRVYAWAGVYILGYTPGTNKKLYNVLLTAPGDDPQIKLPWWTKNRLVIKVLDCKTGKLIKEFILRRDDGRTNYLRAKLIGLNILNSILKDHIDKNERGYRYYHEYVYLYGKVKILKIYKEDDWPFAPPWLCRISYDPYLLIADVDGNGVPELIFTDEDCSDKGIGDAYYTRREPYWFYDIDASREPFRLYLKSLPDPNYPIDPKKYCAAIINFRLYFHDNNPRNSVRAQRIILGIYLIDPGKDGKLGTRDDKVVASAEYPYAELAKFENRFTEFTKTLVIPRDATGNVYVAISFQDPYIVDGGAVDMTLAIELHGMILIPRSA